MYLLYLNMYIVYTHMIYRVLMLYVQLYNEISLHYGGQHNIRLGAFYFEN